MRQHLHSRRAPKAEWAWLIFTLLSSGLVWFATSGMGLARAQEAGKGDAPAAKEAAPPKGEPADEPAPAAKSSAPAAGEGTAPPGPESLLRLAIRASGPIGVFLLLLSIYFTALVIRLFMEFRVSEAVPAPLVERLEAAIRDKKFQDAYDACKDNDSFLARLVRTGIANLPNGRPEAKEAMQTAAEEIVTTLEMKISYLAIIGTLGPDDRAGGHDLGHDHELPGNRQRRRRPAQARKGGRGNLDGPVHHARRRHRCRSRRSSSSPSSATGSPR